MGSTRVNNANFAKRYSFNGSALPADWSIIASHASHSVQVLNGECRLTDVTPTALAETIVRCKQPIKPRCRARFVVSVSAAAACDANRTWAFELVDAAGTTYASLYQASATATTYGAKSASGGNVNAAKSLTSWPTLVTTGVVLEMRINLDNLVFSAIAIDSVTATLASSYDKNFPEPDVELYAQIRLTNGATPPGGAGSYLSVHNVSLFDYEPMNVSIHEGSGMSHGSSQVPVYVGGGSVGVTGTITAAGAAAADAAVSGNPVVVAGRASSVIPTAMSADADVTHLFLDRNGRQHLIISAGSNLDNLILNHRLLSAASINATSVKASAGRVYRILAFNASAAVKYLKLYNKASAPAPATDTPILTIPLQAGVLTEIELTIGIYFATGIAYAITGAVGDTDATAVALNDVVLNLGYC